MDDELKGYKPLMLQFDETNWIDWFLKSIQERPSFSLENGELQFGQVVGRFLGIEKFREDDFLNQLFELSQDPRVIVLSEVLDKTIPPEVFKDIQSILESHRKGEMSLNRMMAFLSGRKLLPQFKSQSLNRHVYNTFIRVFDQFEANHSTGFKDQSFYRVLTDMVKFYRNHFFKWMENFKPENGMPKVIWYGDATGSQQYFLLFLMLAGCDVLLFQTEGKDNFHDLDPEKNKMYVKTYADKLEPTPFPKEKRERRATVTRQAEMELERELNHEGSMMYKPWQFRDYTPKSLTLRTTYDELFILIKEKAFIRHNFNVANGEVHIPTIFAKVSGISKNKSDYWNKLHQITEHDYSLLIKSFPFTKEVRASGYLYHYQQSLTAGELDPEKIMKGNWWKYKQLSTGTQNGIAHAIAKYCSDPKLKRNPGEKIEDLKLYLFAQACSIPQEFLNLLQRFDYSQEVPKIILYNTELNGTMCRSDAAILLLLNKIGIDIVVYNPPGQSDLEIYIDNDAYDNHLLEDMVFNQEYQEPGFISRFFKRIIN